ncbi:dihydrofolate reductase family protein [Puia sp.]|jgi:dihydrofolate reductase|uniref:dihydrofolate reductase family protein n=1 Tax=Puia sp. TaxID=2045100 RepID=UPI002F419726
MRNLIYTINLTIDGCFDHAPTAPDDELLEYCTRQVQDAGLLLYGRKTYQMMVPYWPDILKNLSGESKADIEFARAFESCNKIVFSRTLNKAEGNNTRIVHADLQEEILKLKQEQGKNMLVGGVALPSQLIALGLVDEFLFLVHPVIAGKGKRWFEGIDLQEKLKLVGSKTFKSGCIALHYSKQ